MCNQWTLDLPQDFGGDGRRCDCYRITVGFSEHSRVQMTIEEVKWRSGAIDRTKVTPSIEPELYDRIRILSRAGWRVSHDDLHQTHRGKQVEGMSHYLQMFCCGRIGEKALLSIYARVNVCLYWGTNLNIQPTVCVFKWHKETIILVFRYTSYWTMTRAVKNQSK